MANDTLTRAAQAKLGVFGLLAPLLAGWRWLAGIPVLVGMVAVVVVLFLKPVFTASTTFMPPQQQHAGASMIAALGPLANLAGGAGSALRTPADQYVSLMRSATVTDKLVDRFALLEVYEVPLRIEARRALDERTRAEVGKKDGLIKLEVDDHDAARAAKLANAYVDELRRLTSRIAITEAQQRRAFFEIELSSTRKALVTAQQALTTSGFSQGAFKADPRAAAESYGRLKAELISAEVRLQATRGSMSETTPEVQRQLAALSALRGQLIKLEQSTATPDGGASADYISKVREFKYQESLFEMYSRQYELARIDESREGSLIQVIDPATPPERKSKPRRAVIVLVSVLLAAFICAGWLVLRQAWRRAITDASRSEGGQQ